MKKLGNLILFIGFLTIIFSFGILSLLKTDRDISPVENRPLAQKPALTKEALLTGSFFKDFETYTNDQLIGRDELIKNYTIAQINMGKSLINDIILTDDKWLLKNPAWTKKYNEIDQSMPAINDLSQFFKEQNVEFYFALPPSKTNALSFKLPSHIHTYAQENLNYFLKKLPPDVKPIKLMEHLKKNYTNEEIQDMYFKTDHHWNMDGAFLGYQYIMNTIGQQSSIYKGKEIKKEDYTRTCAQNKHLIGSFNNQLYQLIDANGEKLCYYTPKDGFNFTSVTAKDAKGTIHQSLDEIYGIEKQKDTTSYAGYYTDDYPEIVIENNNAQNEVRALVLKDSFANAIVPHLAQSFKHTSILDLRHYHEKDVYQYMKDNNINMVLFVYSDSNLSGDMFKFKK
ncbi:secondary cell wall polysaccharide O-acetyltransferase PatB1 [Bacillus tropicus]|uniref:secondary cell wall polysaccharide O-acetyltransferase PatB1 n=1 Tax=Bacillus tropicus TaxID=2026188 RepID=UPI00094302F2|nr:secondary cell wall polysaccharide O-acetyltransferase PatB1 [Bacillus tropicus]MEC2922130.1 secondary cell wall polysaccharide O-acetyltransferase PatB1 [Bacillus tropicus]MEC2925006.1 secondary cell wall polysaccharide O-acetyltransferase PatB1 [Bacillus tropicus]MEC2954974.1 secondary cell wall polysaccharide O-acetyltransferase PatB1 [Bacillus tropicus]MEC3048351.1 secondary cell wall polysaccharide O-acetyltransferase PatB1 [Bacillus tropicus]MEC3076248.1 secondary cell wall polysaccha